MSKSTTALIMLAPLSLMILLARVEGAMADATLTRRALQVEHVQIDLTKPFAEVEAALEREISLIDPEISVALAHGDEQRAKELERGRGSLHLPGSAITARLLAIAGGARKAIQYEIGNPLTATTMSRRQLPAALYAPLRIVLYENAAELRDLRIRPALLTVRAIRRLNQVTAVGRDLDTELERSL